MEITTIISIVSAAIALIALGTSLWNAHVTREHNKLSVIPNLIVHHDINSERLTFTLENNGIGPAIIKNFSLVAGEKEFNCENGNSYDKALEYINANIAHERYYPSINEHISAAKEIELLRTVDSGSKDLDIKLNKILKHFKFKITYTSVYKDKDYTYIGNS